MKTVKIGDPTLITLSNRLAITKLVPALETLHKTPKGCPRCSRSTKPYRDAIANARQALYGADDSILERIRTELNADAIEITLSDGSGVRRHPAANG